MTTPWQQPPPPPPPRKRPVALIVILSVVGVLVLCCGGGLIFAAVSNNAAPQPSTGTAPAQQQTSAAAAAPADPAAPAEWQVVGKPYKTAGGISLHAVIRNNTGSDWKDGGFVTLTAYDGNENQIGEYSGATSSTIYNGKTGQVDLFADEAGQKLNLTTVKRWEVR
jgi:hypothetical protein